MHASEFLNLVDEIAATIPLPEQSDSQVAHPVQEIRAALDKHVAKIDTLEADFDKLAEKSSQSFRSTHLALRCLMGRFSN